MYNRASDQGYLGLWPCQQGLEAVGASSALTGQVGGQVRLPLSRQSHSPLGGRGS